jgi:cbb3-type cytochrome oxidase subunit 1
MPIVITMIVWLVIALALAIVANYGLNFPNLVERLKVCCGWAPLWPVVLAVAVYAYIKDECGSGCAVSASAIARSPAVISR